MIRTCPWLVMCIFSVTLGIFLNHSYDYLNFLVIDRGLTYLFSWWDGWLVGVFVFPTFFFFSFKFLLVDGWMVSSGLLWNI